MVLKKVDSIRRNKILRLLYKYSGTRFIYLRTKSFLFYGFRQNCGGRNPNIKCFAGNLLNEHLSKDEIEKIYFDLIMQNGTRKTTTEERNQSVITTILEHINKMKSRDEFDILDIGSSNGVDAYNTYKKISNKKRISKYFLGDLYTEIHYDKKRKLIFDQDGQLLQVLRKKDFVNIYFQFTYPYQRITNLPKYILPLLLKKRNKYNPNDAVKIPLVLPVISQLIKRKEIFSFERLNVFEPIPGTYDIIICIHLLNDFYFSDDEINEAKMNLISSLKPGGFLVVGTATKHEVIDSK